MKLFLKKLLTAPLYLGAMFVGLFGFYLVLGPFNLPYLLKLPQYSEYIFALVFSLIFVSVAAVYVRTGHCRRERIYPAEKQGLFRQVLFFREFWMELLVFALLNMAFYLWIGIDSQAVWWWILLGSLLLTVGATLVFALVDCLLWMISFKRVIR